MEITFVEEKTSFFEIINNSNRLVLDVVCSDGAKGGISTDGKQGRWFFSEELVEPLKICVSNKYVDDMLNLYCLISTILRVVSSFDLVNVPCFQEKYIEASLLIAEKFPWACKNHTLHGLLDNSSDLTELNGGYVLGLLSEVGLESTNKHIKRYLEL